MCGGGGSKLIDGQERQKKPRRGLNIRTCEFQTCLHGFGERLAVGWVLYLIELAVGGLAPLFGENVRKIIMQDLHILYIKIN